MEAKWILGKTANLESPGCRMPHRDLRVPRELRREPLERGVTGDQACKIDASWLG